MSDSSVEVLELDNGDVVPIDNWVHDENVQFSEDWWVDDVSSDSFSYVPEDKKYRNFTFIIYPEHYKSKKFLELRLISLRLPWVLSPLHDKDVYPNGCKYKKPHYHLVIAASSPIKVGDLKSDMLRCGLTWGFGFCENEIVNKNLVRELPSMLNYLVHNGWEKKYQYNVNDMMFFNVDKQSMILNCYSESVAFKKLIDIINDNYILEYKDLVDYVEKRDEALNLFLIKKLGAPVTAYLKSKKRLALSSKDGFE